MTRYEIRFKRSAGKELAALPRAVQRRLLAAIQPLAEDPRPPGARKLVGAADAWRIRVGDYRVIYRIADRVLTIHIIRIGHRKDIYR